LLKEREDYARAEYVLFYLSISGNLHHSESLYLQWMGKPLKELVNMEREVPEIASSLFEDMHFPFEYKLAFFIPFLSPVILKYPIMLFGVLRAKLDRL
jgi:hypothetical protein